MSRTNPFERPDFRGEVIEEYSGLSESEGDSLVFRHLHAKGVDLLLPRHVVHFLYFGNDRNRRQAATAVREMGFACFLKERFSSDDLFLLTGERVDVISENSISRDRLGLTEIAKRFAGEYDGWAAAADDSDG